ncbi:MAG: LytTR family DNA-binding domain-containing protein [Ruminococcus sp.]|nr:LytTR family DNA-binding domain-containing protein [Ruminococcus sp.]
MIRIAVTDDDLSVLERLKEYLSRFDVSFESDIHTEFYSSCEELNESIRAGESYDLIFLDIEFKGMNGTEFGTLLRRKMKNYDTQIVFISSVQEHAMELFRINPIDFLIKPIDESEFRRCMLLFMDRYRSSDTFLEYTLDNIRHRIRSREVLYIESNRKKAVIHTRNSTFSVYGKVSDIIESDRCGFLCISRGVYVNVRHITDVSPKEIHLSDNSGLFISRGCQNAVRDRLAGI